MQIPYAAPVNGSSITLGPFPFAARGVTVVNATNKDATVTDDRGIANVVKAGTIVSFPPNPTHYLIASLAAAAASPASLTIYVSDAPVPIMSSGLALPSSSGMNVQLDGVGVGTETILDFLTALGFTWTITDDAPNTRIKIAPVPSLAILADTELAVDTATIDIQNIPQTHRHLEVLMLLRETGGPTRDDCFVQFNNDSAAHYDWELVEGGPGATAPSATGAVAATSARLAVIPGAGATAGRFATVRMDLPLYTDASATYARSKTWTAINAIMAGGGLNTHDRVLGGTWDNAGVATAINRITVIPGTGNMKAGSRVIVIGKGAI